MEKKAITVFTIFLLFTISAAFRPLSITTFHHNDHVSNGVFLTTKVLSGPINHDDDVHQIATTEATAAEAATKLPVEPAETTTQTLFITRPAMIHHHHRHPIRFSRSNQINRRFYNDLTANNPSIPFRFLRRHPCRNYFHINDHNHNHPSGNDVVLMTDENHLPSDSLEFKHEYGHRHHHHHRDDNEAELFQPKYEIDGDKLQMHHLHHHHQHKGVGFMRAIRKFLKHAFD